MNGSFYKVRLLNINYGLSTVKVENPVEYGKRKLIVDQIECQLFHFSLNLCKAQHHAVQEGCLRY